MGYTNEETVAKNFQLWTDSGEACPEGTVPIRRTTEQDLEENQEQEVSGETHQAMVMSNLLKILAKRSLSIKYACFWKALSAKWKGDYLVIGTLKTMYQGS